MTDKEKAIVMAYTGICMLAGDKFQIYHKYIEDILGRPVWTHEIGLLADEIKEKSKADFMALCADEEPYKAEEDNALDKIRAEISEVYNDRPYDYNHSQRTELFCKVMKIIDKYKAESEE